MKTFLAKISVRLKSNVKDTKGQTLKRAIESFIEIKNLTCHLGTIYYLQFDAENQVEALHLVEKIASGLLTNEVIEEYKIKDLEEIHVS